MAARHSSRVRKRHSKSTLKLTRVKLTSAVLRKAIENERIQLEKAQAILGCLATALEYRDHSGGAGEPDYSDVANVVRGMITGSIDQLDEVNIARLSGDG